MRNNLRFKSFLKLQINFYLVNASDLEKIFFSQTKKKPTHEKHDKPRRASDPNVGYPPSESRKPPKPERKKDSELKGPRNVSGDNQTKDHASKSPKPKEDCGLAQAKSSTTGSVQNSENESPGKHTGFVLYTRLKLFMIPECISFNIFTLKTESNN